ncbi:MAG: DNA-protecting protein DprA, partial [Clostridia bacterium]|nr:DNA-protecting protein DprA [Clostridia bacterium]
GFSFFFYKDKETLLSLYDESKSFSTAVEKFSLKEKELAEKLKPAISGEYLAKIIDVLEKEGIVCVTKYSESYPVGLSEVYSPPFVLYAKGDIGLLKEEKIFSLFFSRKCLQTAKNTASHYAEELTSAGIVCVAGIAEGVDSSVISGGLRSGKIISVIAGGFDEIYPKENARFVDEIVEAGGLVLTEQVLGVKPMPYSFPFRNRIISGLGKALLVVSASKKSGTLHTVGFALDCGKDVYAVPYNIGVTSGEGCNAMIKAGAFLTDDPQDILTAFGIEKKEEEIPVTDETEAEIIKTVKEQGSAHIDYICETLKIPAAILSAKLQLLELKGLIVKTAGNYYSCK